MAILYGRLNFSSSADKHEALTALAGNLKWPGAVEHTFRFHELQGGMLLHPAFQTDPSDHLYAGREKEILVLVSGYFFNRKELLSLVKKSHNDTSNPELVINLFKQKGKDFVKEINGDFTIVIYQPGDCSLLLYRDHVGIRPISWSISEGSFWFSSDGTELCRILGNGKKIDRQYLLNFFDNADTIDLNLLPDANVKKLLPGTYLEMRPFKEPAVVRYWFPERIKENAKLDFKTAKENMTELVKLAVSIRSDRQFKAGVHLSGGLDSGIVAALARQNYAHQPSFKGFSWSPPYDEVSEVIADERKLVDETGSKCNIEPVYLSYEKEDLALFYKNWKLPGKSIHETTLRKTVRKENINLLFSGWGGDEFVSLNNRGVDSDLFFKFKWILMFGKNSFTRPVKTFKRIMNLVLLPAAGIDVRLKKKANPRYLNNGRSLFHLPMSPLYRWKSRRDVHLALLNFGHLSERAEQWFLDGYPEGIEYRYPLLDKRIIEYMLQIPSPILLKKGYARLMLREISDNILPVSVAWSKSKSNPAMFEKSKQICQEMYNDSVREFKEFKRNNDFDFIDFDALEKDIALKKDFTHAEVIPEHVVFILMLKHLDAFTKGYYNSYK